MPNLAAQMADHVNNILLNQTQAAIEVLHLPYNTAITAHWQEDDPVRDASDGESQVRTGMLDISSDVEVQLYQEFEIEGERWQVLSVGGPRGGLQSVQLRRDERETTTPAHNGGII